MEDSLYILIPLSLLLVFAIGVILWWSVRSGQFDDMEGPAYRMLMDDDTPRIAEPGASEQKEEKERKNENPPGRDGF